jgi:hypothetical protein
MLAAAAGDSRNQDGLLGLPKDSEIDDLITYFTQFSPDGKPKS